MYLFLKAATIIVFPSALAILCFLAGYDSGKQEGLTWNPERPHWVYTIPPTLTIDLSNDPTSEIEWSERETMCLGDTYCRSLYPMSEGLWKALVYLAINQGLQVSRYAYR